MRQNRKGREPMEPITSDGLSAASGGVSFSASISSTSSLGLPAGITHDLRPLGADIEAAELPFPSSLQFGSSIASISGKSGVIAYPKPWEVGSVRHQRRDWIIDRALEILPGASALFIISTFIWGAIFLPIPLIIMLLCFDLYWGWRSINAGIHVVRGRAVLKTRGEGRLARAL